MKSNEHDKHAINEVIKLYFMGTYTANAVQLQQAFHPDAHITGCLNGEYHDWTRSEFIARISQMPTAAEHEDFNKEILYIDNVGDAASVKARVEVGNYTFIDYITLLKIKDQWVIRNKSFTTC